MSNYVLLNDSTEIGLMLALRLMPSGNKLLFNNVLPKDISLRAFKDTKRACMIEHMRTHAYCKTLWRQIKPKGVYIRMPLIGLLMIVLEFVFNYRLTTVLLPYISLIEHWNEYHLLHLYLISLTASDTVSATFMLLFLVKNCFLFFRINKRLEVQNVLIWRR